MIEFEKLKTLDKSADIKLCYCEHVAVYTIDNEYGCTTKRILKDNNRYYLHIMHNGIVKQCVEIALSWKPFDNVYIFAFTPDDIHEYEIEMRGKDDNSRPDEYWISECESKHLPDNRIIEGMQCAYNGVTVTYLSENAIAINGKIITVECDYSYVYKLLKTKIKAAGGAKGLFSFLDEIAENEKFDGSLSSRQQFMQIAEKYM